MHTDARRPENEMVGSKVRRTGPSGLPISNPVIGNSSLLFTTRRRFYQYRLESSTHPPLFIFLVPACSATRFLSSYAVAFRFRTSHADGRGSGIRIVYLLLLVPGPTGMALRELRKSMYTCTTHKWTSSALKLWNHSLLSQGCLFSFHPLLSKTIVIGLEYALLVLG
jgi:hypothetical protein